jgi:septal ring factor EnvC (AmiA/AmiB activator)
MATEERFERTERATAAFTDERRKDREEYRQWWRETQRQFQETQRQIDDLGRRIADTNAAITRFAEESREQDRHLGERIDSLVSAIGVFLAKQNPT